MLKTSLNAVLEIKKIHVYLCPPFQNRITLMAEIIPFRAWRYNDRLHPHINELVAPLFDVISDKQRENLYHNRYNSIHLSVPRGNDPAQSASHTFEQWKREAILLQDKRPRIYPYYQYFNIHNDSKTYCRKGFVCMVKASYWDEKSILRHENTIPTAVNDRIELLRRTGLNSSPTHGLYQDDTFALEPYMDDAIASPLYETEDYQGVRDVMGVIEDESVIQKFIEILRSRSIILADGHHRYESSLAFRKEQQAQNPNHTGNELYNYHMMYLTNSSSDHLKVLPTHRLILNSLELDIERLLKKAEEFFTIQEIDNLSDLSEILAGKRWAYGLVHEEKAFKIRLKKEVFPQMHWKFPELIKQMDLTVLHYFFIEKVLGISGKMQRSSPHIQYERNYTECIRKVWKGQAQLALITNEISMEEINEICYSGYTMPPKSTYFYPKVIGGFLFGSVLG